MKTLEDIIKVIVEINELANRLGFTDLKIFCGKKVTEEGIDLIIIVNKIPDIKIPIQSPDYLGVLLIEKLQCNVEIMVYGRINTLYQEYFINNSAPITDETKLLEKFGVKSSNLITFKPIDKDGIDETLLSEAKKYLEKNLPLEPKNKSNAEVANPHSIFGGAVGKAPAGQQKRKSSDETVKHEAEEESKNAKLSVTNGNNHTAEHDNSSKVLKTGRSP